MNPSRWRHRIGALVVITSALSAAPALAQDADAGAEGKVVRTSTSRVKGVFEGKAQRVERISSDVLVRRGATTLAEALAWLSGGTSFTTGGTSNGMMIDGLSASQVTILRDGLPLVDPTGSPQGPIVDLSAVPIDPSTLERIDIYRGLGPVGSGGAGGVVIDLITRRGRGPSQVFGRGSWVTMPDGMMSQRYAVGGSGALGDTGHVRALMQRGDDEAQDIDGDGAPDLAARERWHGEVTGTWRPGSSVWQLQALGQQETIASLGGGAAAFDDVVRRDNARVRARGRWWAHRDVRLDHRLDAGRQHHTLHKRVRSSGFERLKADTTQWGAQTTSAATWFVGQHDLALELGGSLRHIERSGESGALDPVLMRDVGVGVADTWRFGEGRRKHEVFGRVYAEIADPYGAAVQAHLSGAWRLGERLVLRTSASRTRRRPTPEELYLAFDHSEVGYRVQGNADLLPERLHSVDAGLVWTNAARSLGLEGRAYVHELYDVIITSGAPNDPSLFTYSNRDRGRVLGLQAQLSLQKLPGHLRLMAQYTALPYAQDLGTGERLPMRPLHAARAELRGVWLDGALEAWTDASARSTLPAPEGTPTSAPQAVLGVGIGWRWKHHARVLLDVNNLLDVRDPTWGPTGRSAMLTLQLSHRAATDAR